jgi:hypothetical protein
MLRDGGAFDPQTLSMCRAVFDEVLATMPVHQHTQVTKAQLATRILQFARDGQRDRAKLRAITLSAITASSDGNGTHARASR